MSTTLLSVFYGPGEKRMAEVWYRSAYGHEVHMYENKECVEKRTLFEHSSQYAEDCAENWVEGIIK